MTRRALITGVAGGIGSAVARALASDGWVVAGIDRLESYDGPGVAAYRQCDLQDPDAVAASVSNLSTARLHLLVAAAAVQPAGSVLTASVDEWDATLAVNTRSVLLAIRHAHTPLRAAQGSVVTIGSVHGRATSAGRIAYVASKGALEAMTRAAALELAPDGIRVNAVLPGAIDTPMLRAGLAAAGVSPEDLASRTPLGRIGRPEDVASAVHFLASEQARFVTGQTLVVDGGALARLGTE